MVETSLDFWDEKPQGTNKEENKQQNTSEISPKDVLVDSPFLQKSIPEALKLNHNHLFDDKNFSLTKKLFILYLYPNSAYPIILNSSV